MEKDDIRLQPMCCHFLSDLPCDILLGAEECISPFGTYEISMPIDNNAPCEDADTKLTSKNCKDFDVSFFVACKCVYTNTCTIRSEFIQ